MIITKRKHNDEKKIYIYFYNPDPFDFYRNNGRSSLFLAAALTPAHDFASAMLRANLPLCTEHLIAGIILYLVMAFSASVVLRNT